jgi:subtilisin family serine protease
MKFIRAERLALGLCVACLGLLSAGLQAAGSARPSASDIARANGRFAMPSDAPRSWLVRLDGASLLDELRQDTPGSTSPPLPGPRTAPRVAPRIAPRAVAELEAARQSIEARQEPLRSAVMDLGGSVVDAYQVVTNGLLVHATAEQAAAIAGLTGVAAVAPAPILQLNLADVAKTIEADKVAAKLDLDGEGVTVAVIDTGIDYTHAAFGGPGTEAAYVLNEENRVENGSFPTAKVVGGYDFAGWRYSPDCSAGQKDCWQTPQPDTDPLDPSELGHGTHVAGIVAGEAIPGLHAGVAPGARLVALKIFGNPTGAAATTDLAVSAIEWVVRHNLKLSVPGAAPEDPIDVINMSLGADWSGQMVEMNQIVNAAVESGLTVVASAGNAGPLAYVVGSPGSADLALSVASSIPSGESELRVGGEWSELGHLESIELEAIEGAPDWLPQLADVGPVRSQLAWYGQACNTGEGLPSKPVQDVKRRIALIERGECPFHEKVTNAEAHGAVAVLVFTADGRQKSIMTCIPADSPCGQRPTIPALMLDREPGIALRLLLLKNIAISMTLGRFEKTYLTDTLSGFSSRGPARFDAGIKPQVTAPGANVFSALVGSGGGGQNLSGTSMAGPAAAGVAALLWQRNRVERLDLDGADVGALIMNYAEPVIRLDRNDSGKLAAVMRQGAGRINAWRSATGRTLVRSGSGLAALGFGHLRVGDGQTVITHTLVVRNLADKSQTYTPAVKFQFPEEDKGRGVALRFRPEQLTVVAGGSGEIDVALVVTPEALRSWTLRGTEPVQDEASLAVLEIDGMVHIEATDTRGRPIKDGDAVGVPFHVLPRRHACVASKTAGPIVFLEEGDTVPQAWANPCGTPGEVEAYALAGVDNAESANVEVFPARVDIDAVGVRFGPFKPGDPDGPIDIAWAIHMRAPQRIPAELGLRVYLDLNRDGSFDRVVFNHYGPDVDDRLPVGTWTVSHAPLIPGTLDPDLTQVARSTRPQAYDLDASTVVLSADSGVLGLDLRGGREAFDFAVMSIDAVEDFPVQPGFTGRDYAPDGMRRDERYAFDQAGLACVALVDGSGRRWGRLGDSLRVGARAAEVALDLKADCPLDDLPRQFGVFFHYPANPPEAQVQIRNGSVGLPPTETATVAPSATRSATPIPPTSTGTPSATAPPPSATVPPSPTNPPPTETPSAVRPTDTPASTPTAGTGTATSPEQTEAPPVTTVPTHPPSPAATDPATPATATVRPTDEPTRTASATRTAPPTLTQTPEPTSTRVPSPTVSTPAALPDLGIRAVEVSQAVQRPFGDVPLVADRPVVVRVNVEVGWGARPVPGVNGRLHAMRNGQPLPGSPLAPFNPGGVMTVPPAPNPLSMADTLNFLFPAAWTAAGTIDAWIELNPDRGVPETDYGNNRSGDLSLSFKPVPPLELVLVPVEYQPGGVGPVFRPNLTNGNDYGLAMLARLYPLSAVNLRLHPAVAFRGALTSSTAQIGLAQMIGQLRLHEQPDEAWVAGADPAASDGPVGPVYFGVVPAEAGLTGIVAFQGGRVAIGPAGQPDAAARAIGLALGLARVACRAGEAVGDPAYPYPGGAIGPIGLDVFRQQPVPATYFDMMTDCRPGWISDYNYVRLFERLTGGKGGAGGTKARAAAGITVSGGSRDALSDATATGPGWLVSGQIAGDGKSTGLNPIEILDAAEPVVASGRATGTGRYRLELRDGAGRVEARYSFDPLGAVAARGDAGVSGFGFVMPPLAGAGTVVLVDTAAGQAAEIAHLKVGATANTPPLKVDLAVLPASSRMPDRRTVMWQVGGGDGTPARVTLRFSRDGGQSWQVLLAASRETRFELDLAQIGGSAGGILELVASAGGATAARRAPLGTLANRPPRVGILGAEVIRIAAGQPVVLAGEAFDLEDGALADANLVWTLAPRGQTATGRSLVLPEGLPPGVYPVVLTAVDSAGAAQGSRITLLVGSTGRAYLPWVVTRR